MKRIVSDTVLVSEAITLDLPLSLVEFPRCFLGAEYLKADGSASAATAGTLDVQVVSLTNPQGFEVLPESTMDCTVPTSISWLINTVRVIVTPTGIATSTHWRVNLSSNVS